MALNKWTTGDTITERAANNRGIRKGTTSEINGVIVADREDGDRYYDDSIESPQVETDGTNSKRGNLLQSLGNDSNEVTVLGTTPTEVKTMALVKDPLGWRGNLLKVIAEIKTDNMGTNGNCRIRWDDDAVGPPAELILVTTSTTYEIQTGTIAVRTEADGRHTINVYMDDGSGDTVSNREIEFWGI